MNKKELLASLKLIEQFLTRKNKKHSKSSNIFVSRKKEKEEFQIYSKKWFEEVEPLLSYFGVEKIIEKKYHNLFTRLLELSLKNSRKSTYQKLICELLSDFKKDLIIPIIKSAGKITSISNLTKILENVTEKEKTYLNEALGCAQYKFFRGSMVLVWCAGVHRMQKKVEQLGFDEFNAKSVEMKAIHSGRFKRFNKSFNIHSLGELKATVFDTDLLWILEYWCLIDSNQHERLSICFTMRNNSAHPGEAPIKEINLASAFSDIKSIIFDNPEFALED